MQDIERDMTLHFKGIDSEDGTLPMEYLEDIVRFGKALKALSKDFYVHKIGKKRAPAGFKGIDFNMSGLNVGSTIVNFKPLNYDLVGIRLANDTFDIVTRHLSGIGVNMSDYEGLEGYNPSEQIEEKCKGLWSDLDERVSLMFSNGDREYTFSRKRGNKTSVKDEEKSDEINIIGSVYEMDCNSQKFKVQFIDDNGNEKSASVQFDFNDEPKIIEALSNRSVVKVRISGKHLDGAKNPNSLGLRDIELLSPMDVAGRLEDIIKSASKNIKDKKQLSQYAARIRSLGRRIASDYSCNNAPYIYLDPDNNLELEWEGNGYVLTIDIESMHAVLISIDDRHDLELDLNETRSWEKLCELVSDGTGSQ